MQQTMTPQLEIIRPILAFSGSFVLWIANQAIPHADPTGLTGILREFGMPTAILVLALWALAKVAKQLKDSQDARIRDAQETAALYRADAIRADESRRELIRETKEQTKAIKEKT